MVLKPNQLITVLPNLGSEFKIIFDLQINNYNHWPTTWLSVLSFTADQGDVSERPFEIKKGDRIPAIWIHKNKKIYICFTLSGTQVCYLGKTELRKWMKIEICQHIINNKEG